MTDTPERPRILLVCESSLASQSLQRILSARFEITPVASAEQGWEALQQRSDFSVLICGLNQALNETALLERIRQAQDDALSHLPVLLLVGEADDEAERDRAFAAGATDFIHMPFSALELEARVRLHARLFGLYQNPTSMELEARGSPAELLNLLTQEKYFYSRLEQELSFSARHKSWVSMSLIQIDRAEDFEDQFGKKILRAVLRAIAAVIESRIRREDSYAFIGDATFALLYPVTNGLGANVATRRLVETIESAQYRHEETELKVTLSAGVYALLPADDSDAERVMNVLQQRLDKARRMGGAQIVSSRSEQEQNEISIEQALNLIRFQRTDALSKQIPRLVDEIMPLLAFIKRQNRQEFDRVIDELGDD